MFLESACLVSWPVRKQTHCPKKHLFSSDQLDESLCFQGVQLILWLKGRGLKPAISGTVLELGAGQTVPVLPTPAVYTQ